MVHSKTLFQGSNIIKNDLGRLNSLNNKDWSLFIEEKSQTSRWGSTDRPLGLNQTSIGPRPDLNQLRFNLNREEKATGREKEKLFGLPQPVLDRLNRLSHFFGSTPNLFQLKTF